MNSRIERLRQESLDTPPSVSIERALLVTEFYRQNAGKCSVPVLRASNFKNLCAQKTIYIGPDELIVGERGPRPKSVPTFPELNCHSVEDLQILDSRPMTRYRVAEEDIGTYAARGHPLLAGPQHAGPHLQPCARAVAAGL